MSFKWDDKPSEPMNPYAERDFAHAMKEAGEDLNKKFRDFSEELKRIGEQIKVNTDYGKVSFIDLDDMPTEYSGVMRLPASALWESLVDTLTDNGYEVIVRKEGATETEREVDGADKFVVIEFGEVE